MNRIYVTTKYFCVSTEFGLGWGFYVSTEYSYVAIKFSLDKGSQVATKYFLVTTEFGAKAKRVYVMTKNLMSR